MPNHDGQCHYGVISLNSIDFDDLNCAETWGDMFRKMANKVTHTAEQIQLLVDDDQIVTSEQLYTLVSVASRLSAHMDLQNRDDMAEYKEGGYEVTIYYDANVAMVTCSPHKTRANLCSPCYPNTGDLDNCDDASVNVTYCLGPEWFKDCKMPYKILEE